MIESLPCYLGNVYWTEKPKKGLNFAWIPPGKIINILSIINQNYSGLTRSQALFPSPTPASLEFPYNLDCSSLQGRGPALSDFFNAKHSILNILFPWVGMLLHSQCCQNQGLLLTGQLIPSGLILSCVSTIPLKHPKTVIQGSSFTSDGVLHQGIRKSRLGVWRKKRNRCKIVKSKQSIC